MNKKGFTLVELIVSFLLIATISIFLFQIVTIISTIYSEEGIRTELVLEQSNISNALNKDIYQNNKSGNYVKRIVIISENQVDIKFRDGSSKTLFVDQNKNTISYGKFTQKFLSGTTIGNIDVELDYVDNSRFKYNGVSTIKIPISYTTLTNSFDILALIRFDTKEYSLNLEDDTPEYRIYRKYNDGTAVYFNVTTGLECTQAEQIVNYTNNGVDGLNSGCMKFYAFLDSDTLPSVNLILDHNVTLSNANRPDALANFKTATNSWSGLLNPSNYSQSFYNPDHISSTLYSNWETDGYKARFITSDEIARIVNKTSFNSTTTEENGYFYLDGGSGSDPDWHTQVASSSVPSNYAWLFDNLSSSTTYGGTTNSVESTPGYWTADKVVGTHYFYWLVSTEGKLIKEGDGNYMGTRPVIRVSKDKLSNS